MSPSTFVERDVNCGNFGGGHHLCRIFNLLALGHSLKYLTMDFNETSFATFLHSEKIMEGFSKLRNVGRLELNWTQNQGSRDSPSPITDYWPDYGRWPDSSPTRGPAIPIVHMTTASLEVAAQKLISTAQRPLEKFQESKSKSQPILELTRVHTEELCMLLNSRIAFMTQRETALNEAEEHKAGIVLAEKRASELEKMISDVEKDIASMLPGTLP